MPSPRKDRAIRDLGFWIAVGILGFVAVISLAAPVLPIYDYTAMHPQRLAKPSAEFWMGTDQYGRDILSRVVWGMRTSVGVAGLAVIGAAVLGVPLGLVSAVRGGGIDVAVMRFLDALLAFPSLLLAIGVSAITGPGAFSTAIALSIVGIPQMARIVRGSAMVEARHLYIDAARVIGASTARIMVGHILRNIMGPICVQATLFFAIGVLTEAGLSFIGLGVQVPLSSLGSMLKEARAYFTIAPIYAIAPGVVITVIVFALNVAADGLRDRSDPRG
jgi:peptide/nickel transport system permease protein